MKKLFALLALSLLLGGCAYGPTRYSERDRNTLTGMAIGAGTGTAIGCAVWWSGGCWWGLGIGTVTGGLIGASLPTQSDYAYGPNDRPRQYYRQGKSKKKRKPEVASTIVPTPAPAQSQK